MKHFLVGGDCQPSQAPDRLRGEEWILVPSSGPCADDSLGGAPIYLQQVIQGLPSQGRENGVDLRPPGMRFAPFFHRGRDMVHQLFDERGKRGELERVGVHIFLRDGTAVFHTH